MTSGFGGSTIDSGPNAAAAAASLSAGLYPRTNVYEYSSGVAPQIPRWPMCAKWPKINLYYQIKTLFYWIQHYWLNKQAWS